MTLGTGHWERGQGALKIPMLGGDHAGDPGQWCQPQCDVQGVGEEYAVGPSSGRLMEPGSPIWGQQRLL